MTQLPFGDEEPICSCPGEGRRPGGYGRWDVGAVWEPKGSGTWGMGAVWEPKGSGTNGVCPLLGPKAPIWDWFRLSNLYGFEELVEDDICNGTNRHLK